MINTNPNRPHLSPHLTRLLTAIESEPNITFTSLKHRMGYTEKQEAATSTALTRLNDWLIVHNLGRIFSSKTKSYEDMNRETIYRILED